MTFAILNIPYVAYTSAITGKLLGWEGYPDTFINHTSFKVFAYVVGAVLHSIDTPFIWLWRMRGLQNYVIEGATAVKQGCREGWCRVERVRLYLRQNNSSCLSWLGQTLSQYANAMIAIAIRLSVSLRQGSLNTSIVVVVNPAASLNV